MTSQIDRIFYDGHCALCHGFVRFVVKRDRKGVFRFAPLEGEMFRAAVPESTRRTLPDSIVVWAKSGLLLTRSAAVLYVLERLGGTWRILGRALRWVPRSLSDLVYDAIARVRRRLFRPPEGVCPVIPAHLRSRFDL